jgi:hypothetical protein
MRVAPRAWRRNGVAEAETTAARGDGADITENGKLRQPFSVSPAVQNGV